MIHSSQQKIKLEAEQKYNEILAYIPKTHIDGNFKIPKLPEPMYIIGKFLNECSSRYNIFKIICKSGYLPSFENAMKWH